MTRSGGSHCQTVLLLVLVTITIVASRAAKQATSSDRSRTEDYITQYEINTERYRVTTEDGYQLIVYRLLPQVPTKGAVVLQHGIRQSSADWLMLDNNLPMQLLSTGMEVWLGNSRASPESADHTKFSKTSAKYWEFSFHEIGYYDLAAITDAALQISQRKQIHMVAFSEGSTATLTLLAQRPEYNDKITSLNLLAPAAIMGNSQFKLVSLLFDKIQVIFPWKITQILSNNNQLSNNSQKQLEHFQQLILSGRFRQYDHGQRENIQRYGTPEPPDYPLWRITRPVVLHYGGRDTTVHPRDVEQLSTQFPKTSQVQLIEYDKLDHNDFLTRSDAASDVYPMVVESVMKRLQ
ncbi:lipase 1-like [Ochlerotatus camptorhynchus]|uniref:lipase 1-like n=1 Tax=Ochlerotatus camptorhynchus TaxID=644619 RepID=UPI0031D22F83